MRNVVSTFETPPQSLGKSSNRQAGAPQMGKINGGGQGLGPGALASWEAFS